MTVTFGWDASHYDGDLNLSVMRRARSEGIEFFTHKLGEGLTNTDNTAATVLVAARDAGITLLGGYWFIHDNDNPDDEAARCVAVANEHEPWWRDFPGWFWQTDAETSPTGLPSPDYVKRFSDSLAERSGKRVIVYASHGMYGDRLDGLGHPLWNANYPSRKQAGFVSLYPGNSFSGWSSYSGQTPIICQYTSSATIAGLTTCDANAFRGTLAELTAIIEGEDMALTKADLDTLLTTDGVMPNFSWKGDAKTNPTIKVSSALQEIGDEAHVAHTNTTAIGQQVAALTKMVQAQSAAITKLASSGTSVDTTVIVNAIDAVGKTESDAVAALQVKLAEQTQLITDLQSRLASAGVALNGGDE